MTFAQGSLGLTSCFQVLCERFQELTDEPFCPGEKSAPMCWEDWIFNESRRR